MIRASRLAVFYRTDSKILRRKVIADFDAELAELHPAPGESLLLLPLDRLHDDASCRAAIAAETGVSPPSGRCCIINRTGDVIAVCNADPAIDTHSDGLVVASDNAGPGDRYVAGVFLRQHRVTPRLSEAIASTIWLPLHERRMSLTGEIDPVGAIDYCGAGS
jgi:hypothetical protein